MSYLKPFKTPDIREFLLALNKQTIQVCVRCHALSNLLFKRDANGPIYTVLFYAEIRAVGSQSDLRIFPYLWLNIYSLLVFLPATNINFHPELIHGLCWKDANLNITYQIRTSSLYILFMVLGFPFTSLLIIRFCFVFQVSCHTTLYAVKLAAFCHSSPL